MKESDHPREYRRALFLRPVQCIPVEFSVAIQMHANASPLRVMCCAKALPEKKFRRKDSEDFCDEELLSTHVLEEETEAL